MKKVTMATVKAFVKKNHGNLFICVGSSFNGMTDGCDYHKDAEFQKAKHEESCIENTLGVNGAWFVRGGNDLIKACEYDGYAGFNVYNCCGSFVIAIKAA